MVYTPVSDTVSFFDQSQKDLRLSKISTHLSCMQSFKQIGLKLFSVKYNSGQMHLTAAQFALTETGLKL